MQTSPEEDQRKKGIDALRRIKNDTRIEALEFLVSNGSTDDACIYAAITLAEETNQKNLKALKGLFEGIEVQNSHRERALRLVRQYGETAIEGLIELLDAEWSEARRDAARLLGEFGADDAIPELVQALHDDDEGVASEAVNALRRLHSQNAIPHLLPLIEDGNIRNYAILILGELGSKEAIPFLLPLLKEENQNIRSSVATALGNIGSEDAIPFLLPLLDDASYVRDSVIRAIGAIGSSDTIPTLVSLLENANKHTTRIIIGALERIGTTEAITAVKEWEKRQNQD